jgi:hypothetical protein
MTFLEFNFHVISGMMIGIELLSGSDYEEDPNPVLWGLVLDLVIIRFVFIVRRYGKG